MCNRQLHHKSICLPCLHTPPANLMYMSLRIYHHRERRAPAGPNRSPTKYTYLFFFSNLLANLSVPKWRPSGRIPGVACLRLIENPSSILVSPPFSRAVARSSSQPTTTLHLASRAGHSAALLCQHSARCQSLKREEAAQREHR